MAKIGLLAPFEGLYRQSGYQALAAMRAAIAETPSEGVSVLPLALDTSAAPQQARRSAQKLLVDPALRAVIGPLFAPAAQAVAPELSTAAGVTWAGPPVIPARLWGDGARGGDVAWIVDLAVAAVRSPAAKPVGLALAGAILGQALPEAERVGKETGLPVRVVDKPGQVRAGEAVLWLGMPAEGAAFLAALRARGLDAPFWLAGDGDNPVFIRRALAGLAALGLDASRLGAVYWTAWLDAGYADWAATHSPNTPAAYAVYRATQQAIRAIQGAPALPGPRTLHVFQLAPDGLSRPLQDD